MPRTTKEVKPEVETKKPRKAVAKAEVKATAAPREKKNALEISVYDLTGKETKTVELPKEIFGTEINKTVLAQYVRVYLANQRQGTASTKTRGEVIGTTKKVYRQKGTGNARHGSRKGPIFVGGGITHAPKPRDYSLKMNKKQRKQALFAALSMKANEHAIIGIANDLMTMEPKTSSVVSMFKAMNAEKKTLMVVPSVAKKGIVLAARNISYVQMVSSTDLNPYEILNSKQIVFVEDALASLSKHFLKS